MLLFRRGFWGYHTLFDDDRSVDGYPRLPLSWGTAEANICGTWQESWGRTTGDGINLFAWIDLN